MSSIELSLHPFNPIDYRRRLTPASATPIKPTSANVAGSGTVVYISAPPGSPADGVVYGTCQSFTVWFGLATESLALSPPPPPVVYTSNLND